MIFFIVSWPNPDVRCRAGDGPDNVIQQAPAVNGYRSRLMRCGCAQTLPLELHRLRFIPLPTGRRFDSGSSPQTFLSLNFSITWKATRIRTQIRVIAARASHIFNPPFFLVIGRIAPGGHTPGLRPLQRLVPSGASGASGAGMELRGKGSLPKGQGKTGRSDLKRRSSTNNLHDPEGFSRCRDFRVGGFPSLCGVEQSR